MKSADTPPSKRPSARISPLLATLTLVMALVAGLWMGVGVGRFALTSSGVLTGPVLESEVLYTMGMDALILDISNSGFVAQLNQGPLHVGQEEVSRILHSTYGPSDTDAKAREVHTALLHFIRGFPEQEIFRISVAQERPAMADSLGGVLLHQYTTLPECGTGDDVSALFSAARVRFFGASGEDFFNEDHPDCRPPDMVADEVEDRLREEISTMAASGPDSIDTFPGEEGDEAFAALMVQVNRGLLWTHPGWPALLFLVAVGGYVAAHPRRSFRAPLAAFGAGLILYGALALMLGPDQIRQRFDGAGTPGEASEVWGELGSYVMQRSALFSGTWTLVLGAALLAAFVALGFVRRRQGRGQREAGFAS